METGRREFISVAALSLAGLAVGCASVAPVTFKDILPERGNEKMNDYIEMIKYAAMAPSGHNTQPWIFKIFNNKIIITPDLKRKCPAVDPEDRELYIGLGCALENLLTAGEYLGYNSVTDIVPIGKESEIVITPEKTGICGNELFQYIPIRQCSRSEYRSTKIKESDLTELESVKIDDCNYTRLINSPEETSEIIKLVKEGNELQMGNRDFMDELISWIRFNDDEIIFHRDGLAGKCTGSPSVPRWMGKLFMNLFVGAGSQNSKDEKNILSSSAVVLFASKENNQKSWINMGRLYQRYALRLTKLGITSAFINQPCESKSLNQRLNTVFGLGTDYPQMLIRIGYGESMPYSVRRNLSDMMEVI